MFIYQKFQLGQPIRLLLAYTETEYEDRTYLLGPAPDFDRSDWLRVKFQLGLDFPNLPYYIESKSLHLLVTKYVIHELRHMRYSTPYVTSLNLYLIAFLLH